MDSLLASLLAICGKYNDSISNLREELAKKNQLVAELSERMKPLIERNAISKQKELFVDWFDKMHIIEELKNVKQNCLQERFLLLLKLRAKHL